MEDSEIHSLVKTTVREAVKSSHSELLRDIGSMIQQISSPASSSLNSSTYHSVLDAPKFKRRSNEEQFKQNSKVMAKLDLAESHIEKQNIADAKESIIEANDPYNAAFTFSTFNVWPIPAVIPGELHFSAALTVNRRVHNLYIDEDVNHSMFGDILQLPCLGVGIGTCNNIDCCRYQELNIPQLWERFMYYILGNETVCPVESKSVLIQDEMVYFPAIPKPLRTLAKNNYTVRLHFKDDVSKQEQIGCLEFDFEFIVQPQFPITAIVGRRDLDEHVDST